MLWRRFLGWACFAGALLTVILWTGKVANPVILMPGFFLVLMGVGLTFER